MRLPAVIVYACVLLDTELSDELTRGHDPAKSRYSELALSPALSLSLP
jgi:hypothetical protein